MRRPPFRNVLVALFVYTALASASPVRADEVPEGWPRNDYIAYLILSDFLRDLASKTNANFVACVSNDIGSDAKDRRDPSPRLMAALQSEFAPDGLNIQLRLASRCPDAEFWVGVFGSGPSYIAVWLGGGTGYQLVAGKRPLEVVRSGFGFVR